ncbi:MAG: hypothetical protein IJO67_09655 [Clostridia bacterium]|nr:hypothetical protein [Clostridia bacterium]
MKRSTLVMVLCLVLAVAMGVGSTMAYLQDTDADVNVMTLGSVYIEQHEFERVTDENGDYTTEEIDGVDSYVLKDFTQGKPLYPFVGEVNNGYDKIPVRLSQLGHNSRGGMDVFPAKNVQDKFVVVENTGKSDAYVRTIVAFEAGENSYEEFRNLINYSYHFTWEENILPEVVEIDGNNYVLVEFLYKGYEDIQHPNGVLTPGDYAYNSLAQVYMYNTATNEDVESLDGNKNGTYDILVVSQAVQTQGFADAETALNTAFGVISKNSHPWMDLDGKTDEEGDQAPDGAEFPVFVSTADELVAALNEGGKIEVQADIALTETMNVEKASEINLNGHTLTASVFEAKADTTLKNGKFVSGESTYPQLSVSAGTLKLENMDILCEEYCNLVTSGSAQAAEYAGLQVWGGKAVLDNCNITVNTDEVRYSNSVFAIGIHEGEVTMNGGSITINSHGSTKVKYNYEGAIFAGSDSDKVINLNNVTMNLGDRAGHKLLFAWGGNTTVNTTDAKDSWITDLIDENGGKYIINYVD